MDSLCPVKGDVAGSGVAYLLLFIFFWVVLASVIAVGVLLCFRLYRSKRRQTPGEAMFVDGDHVLAVEMQSSPSRKVNFFSSLRKKPVASLNGRRSLQELTTFVEILPAATPSMEKECLICCEKMKDTLIAPCGHLIVCWDCGQILKSTKQECPVCRKEIGDLFKVYWQ